MCGVKCVSFIDVDNLFSSNVVIFSQDADIGKSQVMKKYDTISLKNTNTILYVSDRLILRLN